jgi:hypothetical protein
VNDKQKELIAREAMADRTGQHQSVDQMRAWMEHPNSEQHEPTVIVAVDVEPVDSSDLEAILDAKHCLQQLLEEFEAARDARLNETWGFGAKTDPATGVVVSLCGGPDVPLRECYPQLEGSSIEQWADMDDYFGSDEPRVAARRYIIARDFQEFNPERALMLYKLQNQ